MHREKKKHPLPCLPKRLGRKKQGKAKFFECLIRNLQNRARDSACRNEIYATATPVCRHYKAVMCPGRFLQGTPRGKSAANSGVSRLRSCGGVRYHERIVRQVISRKGNCGKIGTRLRGVRGDTPRGDVATAPVHQALLLLLHLRLRGIGNHLHLLADLGQPRGYHLDDYRLR